jgi:hypothetical protein
MGRGRYSRLTPKVGRKVPPGQGFLLRRTEQNKIEQRKNFGIAGLFRSFANKRIDSFVKEK